MLVHTTSLIFAASHAFAPGDSITRRKTSVELEIRPRAEFRSHHALRPAAYSLRDFGVTQRNRLSITHRGSFYKFHASLQELHAWEAPVWKPASINMYELYLELSMSRSTSLRIGRQAISLDNGRLFSAAPWSQQSRAHEGVRLFMKHPKGVSDFTLAFTRKYPTYFEPSFSPVTANDYKFLFVHHTLLRLNDRYTLTLINSADMFENPAATYLRFTSAARIEYARDNLYLTLHSAYQFGENEKLENISAYYLQPEIRYSLLKFSARLGAEVLSGNRQGLEKGKTHSFVPLYGVAWKFMGNMNLFTRFPADVNGLGLLDPYLFATYALSKQLSFRTDFHLFFLQHSGPYSHINGHGRYLGFENDLSLKYHPLPGADIDFGFSWLAATDAMTLLGKIKDAGKIPVWSYLMVSVKPGLIAAAFGKNRMPAGVSEKK